MSRPLMPGTMRARTPLGKTEGGSAEAGRGSMPDSSHEKGRPGNSPDRPLPKLRQPYSVPGTAGNGNDRLGRPPVLAGDARVLVQGLRVDVVEHAGLACFRRPLG